MDDDKKIPLPIVVHRRASAVKLSSPDFHLDRLKAENKMLRDSLKARGVDPDLLLATLRKHK